MLFILVLSIAFKIAIEDVFIKKSIEDYLLQDNNQSIIKNKQIMVVC